MPADSEWFGVTEWADAATRDGWQPPVAPTVRSDPPDGASVCMEPRRDHRDRQTFEIDGQQITRTTTAETQRLLAAAHARRVRPLCLCRPGGVAMYVAQTGPDTCVIKRMPGSGLEHALRCASYLPPEELSGLGQVLGSAIIEDADTGQTAIRLGFCMSRVERAAPSTVARPGAADSVAADPSRLTLRAVLHYLWQQADLTTWTPGMAGKRNWRIVSWHLRQAVGGMFTKGKPLATRLYIPEPFNVEEKTQIAARRLAAWIPLQQQGRHQQFMMLIGEIKTIDPARFGHRVLIKHLPDTPLMVDDTLLARLKRRFGDELELWQRDETGHLMAIATFSMSRMGVAAAEEMSLMMTDSNWLPYESPADKLLLDTALDARRRFTKSLRYNLDPDKPVASLVFTDTDTPTAAFIVSADDDRDTLAEIDSRACTAVWSWALGEDLPALPPPRPMRFRRHHGLAAAGER